MLLRKIKDVGKACIFLVIIAILSPFIPGCEHDHETFPSNYAYPKLQLVFSPALGQQVEITRVVLSVTAPDIEPIEAELAVDGQRATGAIAVPTGEKRTFTIRAYAGEEVEYEAEKMVALLETGPDFSLELHLERVKLTLKMQPAEITTLEGDTFETEITVEHAKDLFGCTFELTYDGRLLTPVEVVQGDLFGDETLFLYQVEPNRISIGITRRAGAGSVNGSGVISRVSFQALAPGETEVKIVHNDTLAFRKEDGTDVDRFGEIVLKDLKVIIE